MVNNEESFYTGVCPARVPFFVFYFSNNRKRSQCAHACTRG